MRTWRAAILVAVLVPLLSAAAAAAILTSGQLQAGPNNGAIITLAFAQIPRINVAGQGTPEVTITFLDTQAPNPPVLQSAGVVHGVDFSQTGTSLVMRLHLSIAAQIGVNRAGQRVIIVVAGVAAPPSPSPAPYAPGGPQPVQPATAGGGGEIEVVPLKFADVSEVVGILVSGQSITPNDVFTPTPSNLGTPSLGGSTYGGVISSGTFTPQQPAAAMGATFGAGAQSVGQRINDNIAVDRRLNAIILSGSPAQIAALRATIARLDVPLPSVLLETQIVELTDTAAKNVGIDFTNNGGPVASVTLQSRSFNSPNYTANLQAAIFAQVATGGGRILARPQIQAQSGSPASILTGDAIPIVTAITFAGSAPVVQQQVQYVQVGVNLQIQPRITPDGYVTSHIYSEVSSVTGYIQGYPQISQRVASTAATVRDGDSFVIGGLIQENELSSLAKIPGLGDIPLIGSFFRVRHDSRQHTNLYIVVTPRILTQTERGAVSGTPSVQPQPSPAPSP